MAQPAGTRIGLLHFAAGAASAAVIYALCWTGAALGWSAASHLYLSLFSTQPAASWSALWQGVCLSIGFGALAGGLITAFANLFRSFAPR